MSDDRFRAALRAHDASPTPEASAVLVTAWVRSGADAVHMPSNTILAEAWLAAGGRDPRRDPLPGDRVQAADPFHDGRRYKPRTWDVVPLKITRADGVGDWKNIVRRERVGAEGQIINETVLMHSWRRFAREARVLRVGCQTCRGSGNGTCAICSGRGLLKCTAHGPTCIYGCVTQECLSCAPWPPRCAECYGSGCAINLGDPVKGTLSPAKKAM